MRQGETIGYVLERADVSFAQRFRIRCSAVRDGVRRVDVRTADSRLAAPAASFAISGSTFELPIVALGDRARSARDRSDRKDGCARASRVLID